MSLIKRKNNDNIRRLMKTIQLNKLTNFVSQVRNQKAAFEVEPLDVNLAKMQFNLTKRLEREIPDFGDFAPVAEAYESKDPALNISTVKILCKKLDNKLRSLELYVQDRARVNEYNYVIAQGEKDEILSSVNKNSFFEICKNVINNINEGIK